MIGALTIDGRLLRRVYQKSIKGAQVVEFLKHLLVHIQGKLLVVWDGAMIHRCRAVKEFLSRGAAKRLRLMSLPGYAPELNPQEGIWNWLKRVALANVCCDSLAEVRYELRLAFAKLRRRVHVLHGCLKRVGYL